LDAAIAQEMDGKATSLNIGWESLYFMVYMQFLFVRPEDRSARAIRLSLDPA